MMMKYLRPDHTVPFVTEIEIEELLDRGIRGVLLDLDNTLVAWNSLDLDHRVERWVAQAKARSLSLCLVSNARPARIQKAIAPLDIPYVALARKPFLRGFRRAMNLMGTLPKETAMVGDQIFTDVLGANLLGLYSILVELPAPREQWWMRGTRKIEKWVLKRHRLQQPPP